MENILKYSIIYAMIRPEIGEKLSLGVCVIQDDKVEVRYSQKKLDVLKYLYSQNEYKAVSSIVRNDLKRVQSVDTLMYLTRYSNNLITFSPIQDIDTSESNINADWLYNSYVYNAQIA